MDAFSRVQDCTCTSMSTKQYGCDRSTGSSGCDQRTRVTLVCKSSHTHTHKNTRCVYRVIVKCSDNFVHTCRQLFVSLMAFALKVNDRFTPNSIREIATMRMYAGELSPRTKDISCAPTGSGRVFGSSDTLLHTTGLQPLQDAEKHSPSASRRTLELMLLCESPSVVWLWSRRCFTASTTGCAARSRVNTNQDREPTAQNCGTVRETNTKEKLQMLCVIRQVQPPEPIFYDDEDTALLLHCKFNKLHSSGLIAWHKHLSQQANRARTRHRKNREENWTIRLLLLTHGCSGQIVDVAGSLACETKQLHLPGQERTCRRCCTKHKRASSSHPGTHVLSKN